MAQMAGAACVGSTSRLMLQGHLSVQSSRMSSWSPYGIGRNRTDIARRSCSGSPIWITRRISQVAGTTAPSDRRPSLSAATRAARATPSGLARRWGKSGGVSGISLHIASHSGERLCIAGSATGARRAQGNTAAPSSPPVRRGILRSAMNCPCRWSTSRCGMWRRPSGTYVWPGGRRRRVARSAIGARARALCPMAPSSARQEAGSGTSAPTTAARVAIRSGA
mmetsp:Transcript_100668/g.290859  ORF Transcript_100668/g.290859 Transcript_100668/m.290859 type:complete len:223 (+) Transcript_100668:1316-1984(+)